MDFVVFEKGKCQERGKRRNPLNIINFSRNLAVFLFLDTFESRKCLETGKRQNALNTESVQKQGKQQNPLNTKSV